MRSYRELIVWQRSMQLTREIYSLTAEFPREERFGLVSQMRRAAVSIPSNIAEGYVRKNRKEYIPFLSIAFGSAAELETQLLIAEMLGYSSKAKVQKAKSLLSEVLRMLNALQNALRNPKTPQPLVASGLREFHEHI